jgi:hypothetical protein
MTKATTALKTERMRRAAPALIDMTSPEYIGKQIAYDLNMRETESKKTIRLWLTLRYSRTAKSGARTIHMLSKEQPGRQRLEATFHLRSYFGPAIADRIENSLNVGETYTLHGHWKKLAPQRPNEKEQWIFRAQKIDGIPIIE